MATYIQVALTRSFRWDGKRFVQGEICELAILPNGANKLKGSRGEACNVPGEYFIEIKEQTSPKTKRKKKCQTNNRTSHSTGTSLQSSSPMPHSHTP